MDICSWKMRFILDGKEELYNITLNTQSQAYGR